ncbi:MAG: PPK2 family polyphosphate kinase [Actinomycetota bacterium]
MSEDTNELRDEFRARPIDGKVNLAGYDPARTPFMDDEDDAEDELEDDLADELFDLHELVFARKEESVLLVLQGLDCSGKNGTIKHVVTTMNPAGVRTASFTAPTEEEAEEHFLWRIRNELPDPGQLGVFDRSHYEDVLVPMALETMTADEIEQRIEEINEFEQELTDAGTVIVKCMLHISFDEQRYRFLRRLLRDDKRWKFDPGDVETRRHWNEYQAAYGRVIAATSTEHAPWYIIPADHKWYRNWAIAKLLIETFRSMGLAYPQPDFDVEAMRAALEAPN